MKILVFSWKQKTKFDGNSHLDNSVRMKGKKRTTCFQLKKKLDACSTASNSCGEAMV